MVFAKMHLCCTATKPQTGDFLPARLIVANLRNVFKCHSVMRIEILKELVY